MVLSTMNYIPLMAPSICSCPFFFLFLCVCCLCLYSIMKSQNNVVPEHLRFQTPLDVPRTGPTDVPHVSESSVPIGFFCHGDTCTCYGVVTLPECTATNCKRKRTSSKDCCATLLQKRMRYHMDGDVMPSGLLSVLCIPVVNLPAFRVF